MRKMIHNVVVVYNKPAYQHYLIDSKDNHYRNLYQNKNPVTKNWQRAYQQHQKTLQGVMNTLTLLGLNLFSCTRKEIPQYLAKITQADLVITVGGDGTFLETAHFLKKQIIMGVVAIPSESAGALCIARLENFYSLLIDLLAGQRKPMQLARLQIKINQQTLDYLALNEVLLSNECPAATARYLLKINSQWESQKSSGIWMSTATGSTGAIHSAGGKVMDRSSQAIQYLIREPFVEKRNPYQFTQGLLKAKTPLEIISKMDRGCLYFDGTHYAHPFKYGDKIVVKIVPDSLNAVL